MIEDKQQKWRADWLVNDKEWMRSRREEWKQIHEHLKSRPFSFLRNNEIKRMKMYFMTGYPSTNEPQHEDYERDEYFNQPLAAIEGNILFECWFSVDHSDERFLDVIQRSSEFLDPNRSFFRSMIRNFTLTKGSLFSGLDARLYALLGGNRCRREIDYPELDEQDFIKRCNTHFSECLPVIDKVLFSEPDQVNPESVARLMLPEYLDSYVGAFDYVVTQTYEEGLTYKDYGLDEIRRMQMERCRKIVDHQDKYHPLQIEIASELIVSINNMNLSDELAKIIAPYLISANK